MNLVNLVHQVHKVCQAPQDNLDLSVLLVKEGNLDHKDGGVKEVKQDLQENLVCML